MALQFVKVSEITPNPDNPRGIDILQQDEKLAYLKESIAQFGILVPLVLSRKGHNRYQLVDGERRYHAATLLGKEEVPAFIIGSTANLTDKDILFRMFQIHHNREQWGPVQQCHALEGLYQTVAKRSSINSIDDIRAKVRAIAEEIVSNTGIENGTAVTRVNFLMWPQKIKRRLYDNPNEDGYWYICEIEAKIIIPALTNYPEYFEKVPVDEVREALFRKLEERTIERSTDVRRVAPYFRQRMPTETARRTVTTALRTLCARTEATYSEVQDELHHAFPDVLKPDPVSPKRLLSLLTTVTNAMETFDFGFIKKSTAKSQKISSDIGNAATSAEKTIAEFRALLKEKTK